MLKVADEVYLSTSTDIKTIYYLAFRAIIFFEDTAPTIQALYDKDRNSYLPIFNELKNDKQYISKIKKFSPTHRESHMQLTSMVLTQANAGKKDIFNRIVKKFFPMVWDFHERYKKSVLEYDRWISYIQNRKDIIKHFICGNRSIEEMTLILIALSDVNDSEHLGFNNIELDSTSFYMLNNLFDIDPVRLIGEKKKEKMVAFVQEMKNYFYLRNKSYKFMDMVYALYLPKIKNMTDSNISTDNKFERVSMAVKKVMPNGLPLDLEFLLRSFFSNNIDGEDYLYNLIYDQKDIDAWLSDCFLYYGLDFLDHPHKKTHLLLQALIYDGISKVINQFSDLWEKMLKGEMPKLFEQSHTFQLNNNTKELADLKSNLSIAENKAQSMQLELEQLKRENKRLHNQIETTEKNQKELISLREMMYRNHESAEETIESAQEKVLAFFANKKIALLGGHQNWINKMKQLFPNARFVNHNLVNTDFSFLDNMDYVFFNTNYAIHPFYWRICNTMEKNDVPFFLLNKGVNINLSLQEIAECLNLN